MSLTAFKVGDSISIHGRDGVEAVRAVASVAGAYLADSKGNLWFNQLGGRSKGSGADRYYMGKRIYAEQASDRETIREKNVRARVAKTNWDTVPMAALAEIDRVLSAVKVSA